MLRFNGFCAAALANPLFFVFNFGQPIDHLAAALFEVSGFRVGTLIAFCGAHRILSFMGIFASTTGRRGLPNHELYHPLSLLTWPADAAESWRFETVILNRLPEEAGRYSRRFTLPPERA
jgi:hypothetical protein